MSKTPPVLFLLVLFLSVVALFFSELARAQKGGDHPIPPVEDEDADFGDFDEVPPVIDIDDDEMEEDDDVSLSWPPPMPETRHLKQYRVSQLKAFLEERGTTCDACAEKYDWVNRVVDTWNWPRKTETIKATDTSSKTTKNADDDDDDDENETTPEEKRREDERLKRMMDELNGDKERDYSGMDPKKASLLKKLQSKGLSFMGGESMDMNQLEQLVNAMDGVKGRSGEDL